MLKTENRGTYSIYLRKNILFLDVIYLAEHVGLVWDRFGLNLNIT